MEEDLASDELLMEIGLQAAQSVGGAEAVKRVKARVGLDMSDKLAYYFTFLVDPAHDPYPPGRLRLRLGMALRDALTDRGDYHYPFMRLLDQADWEKSEGA